MTTRETIAAIADDKAAELSELEAQAEALRKELEVLESVLDRLPGAPLRSVPPAPRSAAPTNGHARPKARRSLQQRILALASASPDGEVTSSAVRLATGAPSHLIAAALRALVLQGQLSDTGVEGARVAGRGKAPRIYVARNTG